MTIAFTGGGTGGHFYPIIAIAEALNDLVREKRLVEPKLYFLAPAPFDEKSLFDNRITFIRIPAGKVRRYASFQNVTDFFVTVAGTIAATLTLFSLYPDVVVSKGGYASVPTIIHESDAKPGRATLLAAKSATKIAISFDSAAKYFPKRAQKKIARTGIPIRKALTRTESEGAREYLGLEAGIPTILILGGSQGSMKINEAVVSALPDLVSFANVIHQTGPLHLQSVSSVANVALAGSPRAGRYHPFDYLNELSLERAAGAATVVVSRAGATSIAEIGLWKKPAILIPIPEAISHDQRTNAYAFARTGAAVVLEEENLTPHLLASEVRRIATDPELAKRMGESASGFTDPDAARILASEVLGIALTHES